MRKYKHIRNKVKNIILAAGTIIALICVGVGFLGMISQGSIRHFITYLSVFWASMAWLFLVAYANDVFKGDSVSVINGEMK